MGSGKTVTYYRCDGKKCSPEAAFPTCFFTTDESHSVPGHASVRISEDEPESWTSEKIARCVKESAEMAEWQTFLPVEKRMPCKKNLPVFSREEAGSDAEVQP